MSGIVKLKDIRDIEELIQFGFIEDPANCEDAGDHYYHLNNYYLQVGDGFRITVSTISGYIDILCLATMPVLYNMFELKPLYDLFTSGLVEINNKELILE